MTSQDYVIQKDEHSLCKSCEGPMDLLCEKYPTVATSLLFYRPWFYICWNCKLVSQVGTGPVQREDKET